MYIYNQFYFDKALLACCMVGDCWVWGERGAWSPRGPFRGARFSIQDGY